MQIINPATEQIIKEVQEDNLETLAAKFRDLQSAQPLWQRVTIEERVQVLKRFSGLLREYRRTRRDSHL